MDADLLTSPVEAVRALFGLVVSLVVVEFFGLLFYSLATGDSAMRSLMNNATDPVAFPGQFLAFVLASPDRMIVAGLLAAAIVLLALSGSDTEPA